jgi:hypothetical protein
MSEKGKSYAGGRARLGIRALLVSGLVALQTGSAESAFTPSCVMVSNPTVTMADVEFDQLHFRATWQAPSLVGNYRLYVANVDSNTGVLTNPQTGLPLAQGNGAGTLVDSNLVPQGTSGNGPEWAEAAPIAGDSQILYSKLLSPTGFGIGRAKFDGTKWVIEDGGILPGTTNRFLPIGGQSPSDPNPLMVYLAKTRSGTNTVALREIDDASTEAQITVPNFTGGRFIPGKRILIGLGTSNATQQLFQYSFDNKELVQLTAQKHTDPLLARCRPWNAPEVGDDTLIACRLGTTSVRIYKRPASGTLWETYYEFTSPNPTDRPILDMPRPFVFNGQSYIVVLAQADTTQIARQFSDVWLITIPPATAGARRLTDTMPVSLKRDTEPFVLSDRPVVYYSQYQVDPDFSSIWRCETGL